MPVQLLEPSAASGTSVDITVAAGSTNTVAMFQGTSIDNLKLPNGVDDFLLPSSGTDGNFLLPDGGDFFLPDGFSLLLLADQSFLVLPAANQGTQVLDKRDYAVIQMQDPEGQYFDSGLSLRHNGRFKTLGPGVWRLWKPDTAHEFGFQSE